MVVGMKSYHDYKQQLLSVFGFVATYNRTATKYWSTSRHHLAFGDELCQSLAYCMSDAIAHFSTVNGNVVPQRVIVYRDQIKTNYR
jgi:hypothetical protein